MRELLNIVIVVVLSAILLAACGGGNDDSGSHQNLTDELARLNNQNTPLVTSEVLKSTTNLRLLLIDGGLIPSTQLISELSSAGTQAAQTLDCHYADIDETTVSAGQRIVTATFSKPGVVSVGDTLQILFSDCEHEKDAVINGNLYLEIKSLSSDVNCVSDCYEITFRLKDLVLNTKGSKITLNGEFTKLINSQQYQGKQLTINDADNQQAIFTDFNVDMQIVGDEYTIEFETNLNLTQVDGQFMLTTPQTIKGATFRKFANEGEIQVTAAEQSNLLIKVIDINTIEITLDADADGITDEGYPVTQSLSEVAGQADDYPNTLADAAQLQLNTEIQGTIEVPGDLDAFRFTISETSLVSIYTKGTIESEGIIYDETENELYDVIPSIENNNFRIDVNIEPGNYYLVVKHLYSTWTDNYTLVIEANPISEIDDYGNTQETATLWDITQPIDGRNDYDNDVDYFKIVLTEPGDLNVTIDTADIHVNGTTGRLGPGTYYISTHDFTAAIGQPYTLSATFEPITDDHGNDIDSATPLGELESSDVSGQFDYLKDADYYQIDIPSDGYLLNFIYGKSLTSNLPTDLSLYDSSGNLVATSVEYYDLALNLEKVLIRPIPAGTYYIAVEPSDLTQQGNYSFGSDFYGSNEIVGDDHGNTIATATVLNTVTTVTGELSDVHDTDFFKIDVQQNVFLIWELPSFNDDSSLILYNSDGSFNELWKSHTIGENASQLLMAGVYYVQVLYGRDTTSTSVRNYSLTIQNQ